MKKWILIGITLFGFLLRIIGLSNHPAGFTPDEASFGYDAYSILKTGKDQWGYTLPLVFKSFGDDKLPIYTYLAVPSVAIFGLNEFSVRLPNAILGTLTIIIVYFLVKELFRNEKLALLSSFFVSISPWHIMLSRGAFEANLTTFFLPLGIFLFFKAINKSGSIKYVLLSVIFFALNLFTYHTARILTPLIFAILILIYQKDLKNTKLFKLSIVLFIALFAISVLSYLNARSRIASSVITDINFSNDRYLAQVIGEPSIISKLFYNKPVYIVRQFLTNYFSYFSPQFLFINGPAEGTYGMVPGIGVALLTELIFVFGSMLFVIGEGFKKKEIQLLLFWVLISPIPAALTKGPGYAANRVAFLMPNIEIFLAIGALFLYGRLKDKKIKQIFVVGLSTLLFINFLYVAEKYWVGQTINEASAMIYGTKQIVSDLPKTGHRKIIISKSISEPQIYIAFYTKANPVLYQKASKNWVLVNGWVDEQGEYSLGNYLFRSINYSVDEKLKNTILVGTPNDFPTEIKPDFEVNYPNLRPAYYTLVNK